MVKDLLATLQKIPNLFAILYCNQQGALEAFNDLGSRLEEVNDEDVQKDVRPRNSTSTMRASFQASNSEPKACSLSPLLGVE